MVKFQVGIIKQTVNFTDLEVGELVAVESSEKGFHRCIEWNRPNWILLTEDIEILGEL